MEIYADLKSLTAKFRVGPDEIFHGEKKTIKWNYQWFLYDHHKKLKAQIKERAFWPWHKTRYYTLKYFDSENVQTDLLVNRRVWNKPFYSVFFCESLYEI